MIKGRQFFRNAIFKFTNDTGEKSYYHFVFARAGRFPRAVLLALVLPQELLYPLQPTATEKELIDNLLDKHERIFHHNRKIVFGSDIGAWREETNQHLAVSWPRGRVHHVARRLAS